MQDKLTPASIVFVTIVALLVVLLVLYMIAKFVESAYLLAYRKPPFVHFYPIKRKVPAYAKLVLESEFGFYRGLSDAHKEYFQHRVATFIKRYKFIGREGMDITNDMKIKVAATWVTLTFGLRHYLTDMFGVIILYPDVYRSVIAKAYHYGEFNVAAGAVVFSWKHFEAGLNFKQHNVNLGLHEFAHVMHTGSRRKNFGAAGAMYLDMYQKIMEYVYETENLRTIVNANYFRHYAYTNEQEFMAVMLEYFFETPEEFSEKLPELFDMVAVMMNYRRVA